MGVEGGESGVGNASLASSSPAGIEFKSYSLLPNDRIRVVESNLVDRGNTLSSGIFSDDKAGALLLIVRRPAFFVLSLLDIALPAESGQTTVAPKLDDDIFFLLVFCFTALLLMLSIN